MSIEVFIVEDMMCSACQNTITKTLTDNENISNVTVDLEKKEVTVEYDENNLDVEEILSSLDNVGFPATIKKKP
ncbi:MAG: hypothetical protein BZ137_04765 [Methanosphaera sp. rholeuAM130]|nr:MAG: hypothetical protein BZ137_04765 [Methanosphaera sp. rholeuAM130]